MTNVRVIKPALAALVAAAACVGGLAFSSAQPAQADTYSDLINAQNQHAASVQREAELKQQLAGASQDLANKVLELDDLTNNKIVAAQAKVTQANEDAATAQDEADAASGRLSAAQKDKETLEEQIKQTGKDYDDAHAAVAQLARDEMHGSNASDVMSVVTGATSTQDFVNSMQSRDALSRNEANAASSAATSLSTSKNRGERLAAIEKQIAVLKTQADEKAASAQTAAETAQSERDALDKLRQEGEARRDELSSMIDSLDSQSAKQAARTVLIASQVDSYNRQFQKEQQDAANRVDTGNQGGTPSTPVTPLRRPLRLRLRLRRRPPPPASAAKAHRTVITATPMSPASARIGRMNAVGRWALARRPISAMAATGGAAPPRTACAWTTTLRSAPRSPSCLVRTVPTVPGAMLPWLKPCMATAHSRSPK